MPSLFLDVAVRAALIALGTACILWALRIRTAAVRHAAWTTVVIAMLLLPIWSVAGPKIPLAVLPASAVSPEVDFAPANLSPQPSVPQPGATRIAATASTVTDSPRGLWVFIGVYMFGLSVLLIRLAIGTSHAHRLRRKAVVHAGRATSARCATPITVGWLSPVLILPQGWERWSAGQLDAVLTHEYEHARRHDPLVQWLALLNRAIFWFHPLAWWLERHLANLAEEACDAAVIRAGHSPQEYSDYLIDMAHALRRQGRRLNVAGAIRRRRRRCRRVPEPSSCSKRKRADRAAVVRHARARRRGEPARRHWPADPPGSFPHIPYYAIGCTLEDIESRSNGRMEVEVIGQSALGRDMYKVTINALDTRAQRTRTLACSGSSSSRSAIRAGRRS